MDGQSTQPRKAQLDKEEREHLEDIVTEMRDRVEANVRYQLEEEYDLDEKPDDDASLSEAQEDLVEAIELEVVDGNGWEEGYEQYITGVGYTIINRLAALRCMEVRDFIEAEVTAFRDDGLTPAADRLVTEEFMLEEEAVLEAYRNACDDLAEEIEILFDRSTAYSLIDPDDDTFEDLCGMLDEVHNEVWRGDDVLGWVYEYYNKSRLSELRHKAHNQGLEAKDISPANQFYTPHWVVRLLTDNSLGKLYAESTGDVDQILGQQHHLNSTERVDRVPTIDQSPDIASLCTYMTPAETATQNIDTTEFKHPSEISIIDPACGSGHFLLYAYDVLERIWLDSDIDIPKENVPKKILKNNIYGVDLDLRACQLATFNLYLKARARAESAGAQGFTLPEVGIVCADTTIADVEEVEQVFDEVASDQPKVREALNEILSEFKGVQGLGSLLDVKGTLSDEFLQEQTKLTDTWTGPSSLTKFLDQLHNQINQRKTNNSFLAQDLNSFLRLLVVLSQDYDVALMNPPYGSGKKMPDSVQKYVKAHYEYSPEYYINFFEVCDNLVKQNGRIGMLIPRTFMMKRSMQQFREDFVGDRGTFDFLAEFGLGILDNATVRTVGTVVRSGGQAGDTGTFIRLHDVDKQQKEKTFAQVISEGSSSESADRLYNVELSEFELVPGTPLSYYTPSEVRALHDTNLKIDPDITGVDAEGIAKVAQGMATGKNDRFLRYHWETSSDVFRPYAKGGEDAWVLPRVDHQINWQDDGKVVQRYSGSLLRNSEYYGQEGLTWTAIKETGHRFGYLPSGHIFDMAGSMVFLEDEYDPWLVLAAINSTLYHGLFLSITPERQWTQGEVGRIPWHESKLEGVELTPLAKEQYQLFASTRTDDPTSIYYISPSILPTNNTEFFYEESGRNKELSASDLINDDLDKSTTIIDAVRHKLEEEVTVENKIQELANQIDDRVYEAFSIDGETQSEILQEIHLRTAKEANESESPDPELNPKSSENYEEPIKNLLHHFTMKSIREKEDGIIPIRGADHQTDIIDHLITQFEDVYGEYAEDRLVEVDELLGTESASEEAYPNIRSFVENNLFEYHIDKMENTPVIWKITTKRLVTDPKGEGFACLVDYHAISASLFDRLSTQYLESRKAKLRERRSFENQRRNDESLSANERANAEEQFKTCESGLEQISELEAVMEDLASVRERDFGKEGHQLADELESKVREFRQETIGRLERLDELREMKDDEWFKNTFSPKFWETVQKWRGEWIDALDDLGDACDEYTKASDIPIEPHLADLFTYFNGRLKGSDHYSSTGILFMTYYFEREGEDLLDDENEPHDHLTEDERLLALLATGLNNVDILDDPSNVSGLDEYKQLAEEIGEICDELYKRTPTDWKDRAISEITTAGYQPNQKHGVAINILPLVENEIVPASVDNKVL